MAKSPRKRFNAFDDFPNEETAVPTPPPAAAADPAREKKVERIERLPPSQMIPDRFQPRRLLPTALRRDFFSGKMDCYTAAARWIEMAREDPAMLEQISRLMAMGTSFEEHGQIKPITGTWVPTPDGTFIFRIETGERRFWAACLQAVVSGKIDPEPELRVEAVERPTRQRQVLENRHAETPSAVGQACEVAALILAAMEVDPDPAIEDEFDYFRQARSQRMPYGMWEKITPVMQHTRERLSQLLKILELPTPLLEMADRHRLPERVLREILALPEERRSGMILSAIRHNLTSDDVAELSGRADKAAQPRRPTAHPEPGRTAAGGLRRFAYTLGELDELSQSQALDEIADTLVASRQAEGVMKLLEELSLRVNARLSRMGRY